MKKDNKSINVYWAPHSVPEEGGLIENWNMMYEDLQSVFQSWTKFDIKDGKEDSFIKCPAFQNLSKNMYAFNFPIDSSYKYKTHSNLVDEIEITPTSKNYVSMFVPRDQTMSYGPSVELALRLHMFAEEPLEVMLTGPYLQNVEYMKYGFLTSGQFDIGQWFRTLNAEVQLNGNEGEIHFKKGEPLFYIKFLTDKKVNLKRFELTSELDTYSRKCITSRNTFGLKQTLSEKYDIFNKSRTREIVLKKIKENLI